MSRTFGDSAIRTRGPMLEDSRQETAKLGAGRLRSIAAFSLNLGRNSKQVLGPSCLGEGWADGERR